MATPRLPFLWPMLFRTAERAPVRAIQKRALRTTAARRQEVQQRYGSANEPPPHFDAEARQPVNTDLSKGAASAKARADADVAKKSGRPTVDPMLDTIDDPPVQDPPPAVANASDKPLESIMDQVPDPATPNADKPSESRAMITYEEHMPPIHVPHMETPRYVHHFDTYGLVKRLEDSGWKNEQSVTLMKAVRLMLADNMDLAREALVSKSQVENEQYLFKAACSELKTEVSTRRKAEQDKMRSERTQLQHELDILNQRLGQESANLKDDLKGMFDDRKMIVRNEQREMERMIQELNYKITVSLQADSKSDVESLRWVMTRRVIITLGLIVGMVVTSLKLFSNAAHEKEMEAKRRAKMRDASTQSTETGTDPMPQGEMLVKEGDNPAYVSLG